MSDVLTACSTAPSTPSSSPRNTLPKIHSMSNMRGLPGQSSRKAKNKAGIFNTFDSSRLSAAARVANEKELEAAVDAVTSAGGAEQPPSPKSRRSLNFLRRPRSDILSSRSLESSTSTSSSSTFASSPEAKDAKIKALEQELYLVKCQRKQERIMAHVEMRQLRKENAAAERRIERFYDDLEDRVQIEEYASFIQQISPTTAVGPSHLAQLQAQLCKSLHNQGVLEGQIDTVKEECNKMVESIKDELAAVLQERDAMEKDLTIKLRRVQAEKKEQAKLFQDRLASRVETIQDFVEYSRISSLPPPPPPPPISAEYRDEPPNDIDPADTTQLTIDSKIAGIAHRLEKEQLQREHVEDELRRQLDDKTTEIDNLKAKLKSLQERSRSMVNQLDQKRQQEIQKELKRTHKRHASHSTVTTSASNASRASSDYSSARSIIPSHSSSSARSIPSHCRGSSDESILYDHHIALSAKTW